MVNNETVCEYDCVVSEHKVKVFGGFYTKINSTNRNQIPDDNMELIIRECCAELEKGDNIKVIIKRVVHD